MLPGQPFSCLHFLKQGLQRFATTRGLFHDFWQIKLRSYMQAWKNLLWTFDLNEEKEIQLHHYSFKRPLLMLSTKVTLTQHPKWVSSQWRQSVWNNLQILLDACSNPFQELKLLPKLKPEGWSNGSATKGVCCSCRGLGLVASDHTMVHNQRGPNTF